ncbi:MAG: IS66 family insertion sequence element accessory protein TnpB [Sphaerochaetaceae bacterium]
MFLDWQQYSFYIRPGKTDMRKRAFSLSMIVESNMLLNPFNKSAFLFCSGSKKILKVIVWDSNGFWELTKRLEVEGTFSWPQSEEEALEITLDEIKLLLKGADPFKRLKVVIPHKVS